MPHVTFIHGISNKPEAEKLKQIWLDALASDNSHDTNGIDLGAMGVTTSMIYWADVLYDKPEEIMPESFSGLESMETMAEITSDPDMAWRGEISGDEKAFADALGKKLSFDMLVNDDFIPEKAEMAKTLERIPLPWFIKRRMMKWLLKDVHHYLFNKEFSPRPGAVYKVQDEIRRRVLEKLNAVQTDRHIVISHSMGTVIMYDCLKRVAACPHIDGLITIGSPLGIDEVQDKFAPEWTRNDGFPAKVKGKWINIYDPLDPVTGFDGNIANDYKSNGQEIIEVISESNWGSWRHNISHYLSMPKMRASLSEMLNL